MKLSLEKLSTTELADMLAALEREYGHVSANRMALDLSRGKPAADQLDLSQDMELAIGGDYRTADGTDARNYGGPRGIREARELGAELLGVPVDAVLAGGNSSLALMHLVVETALETGLWGDARHWRRHTPVKLLAPVPGYDRHFVLSESLGIELINVPMQDHGPDLDAARALITNDPNIKGVWCVPKYSNPTGCTYSNETVAGIAGLANDAAADDFVVLWDNAYTVHDIYAPGDTLASLYDLAKPAGTSDHVVQFASTSKITHAGAGVAFLAASPVVLESLERRLSVMTIGPDKVNQLRHARFLKNRLAEHMQAHAALLKPKFDLVLSTLEAELGGLGIAQWSKPRGGYFVSLDLQPGLARAVVDMAQQVGLTLTPAGATFPYGRDPQDRNVRIAPTYANVEDLNVAMQLLTLCVKLATVRQRLNQT